MVAFRAGEGSLYSLALKPSNFEMNLAPAGLRFAGATAFARRALATGFAVARRGFVTGGAGRFGVVAFAAAPQECASSAAGPVLPSFDVPVQADCCQCAGQIGMLCYGLAGIGLAGIRACPLTHIRRAQ